MTGQIDTHEGRVAYAEYLREAHPDALESFLDLFDVEERALIEADLDKDRL